MSNFTMILLTEIITIQSFLSAIKIKNVIIFETRHIVQHTCHHVYAAVMVTQLRLQY